MLDLSHRNAARVQGVGALLVGLKPEMSRPQMVSLVGHDAEMGATWAFPPTLFLSVMLDHQVILQNMKHTIAYFLERVRGPPLPPALTPAPSKPGPGPGRPGRAWPESESSATCCFCAR